MECAAQITGGYFADPGFKDVPNLAYVGFPIAEVAADGRAVITKLADAGGLVSTRTVKEQLLYEVHDPAAYVTPTWWPTSAACRSARTGPIASRSAARMAGRGRIGSRSRSRSTAACWPKPASPMPGPGAKARAELAGAHRRGAHARPCTAATRRCASI